jgi:hypothetical protein
MFLAKIQNMQLNIFASISFSQGFTPSEALTFCTVQMSIQFIGTVFFTPSQIFCKNLTAPRLSASGNEELFVLRL